MARRGENIHKRKDGRWEGRYIKARTPDRRICWGYIYGTTYAEVKQRLIHKKSEYGGFQLIDAHLTFTELAEAWLQSVKCGLKESTSLSGSALTSGVQEFSLGADKIAAFALLWLFRCGGRLGLFSVGSMASHSFFRK